MPVDRPVSFLAVDEIQLCADPERGHIFTDRLLHARGIAETMFLGAETIRPVLQKLVPEAEFVTRPRFSTLTYSGPQKRSEEHTSELQSLMRISYAVFCLKKKKIYSHKQDPMSVL